VQGGSVALEIKGRFSSLIGRAAKEGGCIDGVCWSVATRRQLRRGRSMPRACTSLLADDDSATAAGTGFFSGGTSTLTVATSRLA